MNYQIIELRQRQRHAGSKAREDVAYFAKSEGFEPLYIKCYEIKKETLYQRARKFTASFFSWQRVKKKVKKGSYVLLQNPFYNRQFGRESAILHLKNKKKCRIISVVHDVEVLRGKNWNGENMVHEFEFMKQTSDYVIVHNEKMLNEFKKLGFKEESLISLKIFDYKTDVKINENKGFETLSDIAVAGNLNPKKSPYVYMLENLENAISVNLYGPNFEGEGSENINYCGSYPPEEVPSKLNAKFGLVWDGDSLDTCSNETGEYLKYNNPHKTSLYIASGLPVIIWNKAAMADFVKEKGIGFVVNSLEEIKEKISAISKEEYSIMINNVLKERENLLSGAYLKSALKKAQEL